MKGSKSSSDAKGLELTAGLAMAGAEENEVIPNGSSNPELALKVSLKFKTNVNFFFKNNKHKRIQVNLCQKLSFLNELTHNMTRGCSLNSPKITSSEHVVHKYCFECQNKNKKQFLYATCSELVFLGEFDEQSLVILWVN